MSNYQSTIKLRAQSGQTILAWSPTFEPQTGREGELTSLIEGVYQAGIDHLKQHFGG